MFRIALINMPFANLGMPSIALTQLKTVVEDKLKDQVSVDVYYLNHDFANYLGVELYELITSSADSQNAGLGDWFFRQTAFPALPNNAGAYLSRYFPFHTEQANVLKSQVLDKRRGLDGFLDSLISKYALDEAQVVGFTSMFMQSAASFSLARRLKEHNANITTVIGGANCESPMGQVIVKHVESIDYVFSGPALINFPEFVAHCMDQQAWKGGSIKGIFTKKNYLFQSGPDAIGEELSIDVPIELDYQPFLNTLNENFPQSEIEPVLLFETSRGCWWGERAHCTFCGLNGMSMAYRAMSPTLALKQFESLFKFAPQVSRLDAVDNILPKSYLQEVLPLVNTPESMSIFYEVKADLSESDVQTLAKARVKLIQPGIESLATTTLKLMKKGTSAFRNLLLMKFCAKYGVEPGWNLLIGFPGEGAEVYRKYVDDIPLLTHLPPPSDVYPVRFDRYSPYFMKSKEYGLDLHPVDYYSLIYPFPPDALDNLAYYFSDLQIGAEYAVTVSQWIGKIKEKIDAWVDAWRDDDQASPKLFLSGNGEGSMIHDSRSGQMEEYAIPLVSGRILDFLALKPKRVWDVAKAFEDVAGFDAAKEVAFLRERGLLFQEEDRFLSLVLSEGEEGSLTPTEEVEECSAVLV
ncbi:MAG TPA: RiPP maturation radical SAM C-methyltransferase [Pyrinomonadaceae bacterium]|jgi:ribosomal peptide maturation radical SAM protein 1|nr:RiPP maturation radical SAM C-methyltransferase [Pyrinomonadaceae bacterium]